LLTFRFAFCKIEISLSKYYKAISGRFFRQEIGGRLAPGFGNAELPPEISKLEKMVEDRFAEPEAEIFSAIISCEIILGQSAS
jgi:hypothetical protein